MNKIHKQGINKLSRVDNPRHIVINRRLIDVFHVITNIINNLFILNNKINTFDNNIPGEITTQQPKQLIIINSISLMILQFEYFNKIMQKTYPID